jgi:hypothetical protein
VEHSEISNLCPVASGQTGTNSFMKDDFMYVLLAEKLLYL